MRRNRPSSLSMTVGVVSGGARKFNAPRRRAFAAPRPAGRNGAAGIGGTVAGNSNSKATAAPAAASSCLGPTRVLPAPNRRPLTQLAGSVGAAVIGGGAAKATAAVLHGAAKPAVTGAISSTPAGKPVSRQPFRKGPLALRVLPAASVAAAGGGGVGLAGSAAAPTGGGATAPPRVYVCLYHKNSQKKKKTYFDGFVVLEPAKKWGLLVDADGKQVTRTRITHKTTTLEVDTMFSFGYSWDAEITGERDYSLFSSGRLFLSAESTAAIAPPKLRGRSSSLLSSTAGGGGATRRKANPLMAAAGAAAKRARQTKQQVPEVPVIDNFLDQILRPHQRDGVFFLWRVITGQAKEMGENYDTRHGAILADEMGLGKTLTSIALAWLLLKQYPQVKRVVIVTPASLVQNWGDEFHKWLGSARLTPIVLTSKGAEATKVVKAFVSGSAAVQPVLIVSYEMFRKFSAHLCKLPYGFLMCDEGHRMKSGNNKTVKQLKQFPSNHRLIITGTPIQNNLAEFFEMINFVLPGQLGSLATFNHVFANPIDASRDKNASADAKRIGEARSAELVQRTSAFILRRNSSLLTKYLPERREFAVCCKLTPLQQAIYSHHIQTKDFRSKIKSCPLELIASLKKLCNHPDLVTTADAVNTAEADAGAPSTVDPTELDLAAIAPAYRAGRNQVEFSGKLAVAQQLLDGVLTKTADKVVIVSNYTQTLDVIGAMLKQMRGNYGAAAGPGGVLSFRLDGSTDTTERQALVNRFNGPTCPTRCFLLSSKAGGVGLNLVGANRLLLFDPDWNPATDSQVMARVWRFGQIKVTHIYRLLATGTIDERIYQRQIAKNELATTVVDSKAAARNFSHSELRQLFLYDASSTSTTAELMRSRTQQKQLAAPAASSSPPSSSSSTSSRAAAVAGASGGWVSFDASSFQCGVMREVAANPMVTYVHCASSKNTSGGNSSRVTPKPAPALSAVATNADADDLELESDED